MRSFKLALNTSKFDPVNSPGISASMKIGITDEKQDPIKSERMLLGFDKKQDSHVMLRIGIDLKD